MNIIKLPNNANFNDIKDVVKTNNTIGYKHKIIVGERYIIAVNKYTWVGRVAKTCYLHIFHVTNFIELKVITHWREQKNGNFKTL